MPNSPLIKWFTELGNDDIATVGGKNASLGEMTRTLAAAGIAVPPGFALTADAYWTLLRDNQLHRPIGDELDAYRSKRKTLSEAGKEIRKLISTATLPAQVQEALIGAYRALGEQCGNPDIAVAVRSSATAEDLPNASFAGQQETFLNVAGERELLAACQRCHASLFTDRAIAYREANGFEHMKVALSIGVQRMVRSDVGSAGVMFTLDTETGFPDVVLINAAYGLGENVVKGSIDPDELLLFKPALAQPSAVPILRKKLGSKALTMVLSREQTSNVETPAAARARFSLSDADAVTLGRWAVQIEAHYSRRANKAVPMDIEWAKDGVTGELFIVQARPETVNSQITGATLVRHTLLETGVLLAHGRGIGDRIATGTVMVLKRPSDPFVAGSVLVTAMTDPDWLPLMRQAAAIVTDHGGRTCHAAILSRELGIAAIVGTGDGTSKLAGAGTVTVSCAQGEEGRVYQGALRFEKTEIALGAKLPTHTRVLMNLADPASAFRHWRLPCDGIGLARMEFIIANEIGVHPMALLHPERVTDMAARSRLEALRIGETQPGGFFVEALARGVATLAAAQYPKPVIVRMSDFKTNEYAGLLGGPDFEPKEENPMLGFRGASRYYHARYKEGFLLECAAMRMARETIGLDNIVLMIPFCRTLEEADKVIETMAAAGLARGQRGLKIYVMCEIPSNVLLAEGFAQRFDGFSIGSNDLTQLTLGIDRDSEILAGSFTERDPAVIALIRQIISRAHKVGAPVGLCGQAPSDDPSFADLLVGFGIDSISVNPDSIVRVREAVFASEAKRGAQRKRLQAHHQDPELRAGIW